MHLLRLLAVIFVTAVWLGGQDPVYTLKVDVPLVSVEVAAFDGDGRSIATLGRETFHIYEDGVVQEVRNFAPVSTPYNTLLLFDRSGSTQNQWPFMQRAVARFLENLRAQDKVSMAAFDDDFQMLVDWTANKREAVLSLDRLIRPRAVGGTDFYGAVERAARRRFNNVTGRRAIIVFSDGRDTRLYRDTLAKNRVPEIGEDRDFQRTIHDIRETQIPIYVIAINTDRNLGSGLDSGNDYLMLRRIFPRTSVPRQFLAEVRTRMEQMAEQSGGRILFPAKLEEVADLYRQISLELSTSYSLGYMPTDTTRSGVRKIEVRVDGAERIWQSRSTYSVPR